MGEHGLTNGTRPHPELGVLCRFRVASQVFAQTTLVHVVFSAHGTGMVSRPAFGHVRTSTDVGVACERKRHDCRSISSFNSLRGFIGRIFTRILLKPRVFHRIQTYSVRRLGTQWSDRCGGLSCVRPTIRCLGTVCGIADKMWCSHRPSGRRAAGARPCGVQLPENKKNVPENNNKNTSGN